MSRKRVQRLLVIVAAVAAHCLTRTTTEAFVLNAHGSGCTGRPFLSTRLYASGGDLKNIPDMKAGEIRAELESYGISTKTFLEKKEMEAALKDARAKGMKATAAKTNTKTSTKATAKSANETTTNTAASREGRLLQELVAARAMNVGELKLKLRRMGISTRAFLEKSDFVNAYAQAIVDGVAVEDDPEYRTVDVQKMDKSNPALLSGVLIDIQLER
jgi:hypothetical protein